MRGHRTGFWAGCLLLLALFALPQPASAHRAEESYLYFAVTEAELSGRIEVALADLARLFPDLAGGDGRVSEAAALSAEARIFGFFADRVRLLAAGRPHSLAATEVAFLDTPVGRFAQFGFVVADLTAVPSHVTLGYDVPLPTPGHRGFALIESNTRTGVTGNESRIALAFLPGEAPQRLALIGDPPGLVFQTHLVGGALNTVGGVAHLTLVLAFLLLAAVRPAMAGGWAAAPALAPAALWLAGLGALVALAEAGGLGFGSAAGPLVPVWALEATVGAALLGLAAVVLWPESLVGGQTGLRVGMLFAAMAFGLALGLRGAPALDHVGTYPAIRMAAIAGWSLGGGFVLLSALALGFPLAWAASRSAARRALPIGGVLVAVMAAIWLVERWTGVFWRLQHGMAGPA